MVSDRILTEASGKLMGHVKPQGFIPAVGGLLGDRHANVNRRERLAAQTFDHPGNRAHEVLPNC